MRGISLLNIAFLRVFQRKNSKYLIKELKRISNYSGGVLIRTKSDDMAMAVAYVLRDGVDF